MKEQIVLFAAVLGVLVGCDPDPGKPSCQGPGSCQAGNYCARTPDGNVCWPDSTPPVISLGTVACSTNPCRRDSVLTVSATVEDESQGNAMGEVKVTFGELDPGHPLTLQKVSGSDAEYTLDVPLANLPFPYFAHEVAASLSATDEAGNAAQPAAVPGVSVTRARWTATLKGTAAVALSAPAVLKDGRVALGGSDGKLYLVADNGLAFVSAQLPAAVRRHSP